MSAADPIEMCKGVASSSCVGERNVAKEQTLTPSSIFFFFYLFDDESFFFLLLAQWPLLSPLSILPHFTPFILSLQLQGTRMSWLRHFLLFLHIAALHYNKSRWRVTWKREHQRSLKVSTFLSLSYLLSIGCLLRHIQDFVLDSLWFFIPFCLRACLCLFGQSFASFFNFKWHDVAEWLLISVIGFHYVSCSSLSDCSCTKK